MTDIVKATDLESAISLPFEDVGSASDEIKKAYQDMLNTGNNTFGQSKFSEKHFVLGAQLTPHRTYRQACLHYDQKRHALAEAQAGKAKAAAKLQKVDGDLKRLDRLRTRIAGATHFAHLEDLPSYSCEVLERETVSHVEFKPTEIVAFYTNEDIEECREDLLTELDAIIVMKRAEASQVRRGQFQQEKLEKDAVSDIAWYEKEVLPQVKAAVDKSIAEGIDFEEEEKLYWKLRLQRDIESRQLEKITGIPHDYLQTVYQLPQDVSSYLIEFSKRNWEQVQNAGAPALPHYKRDEPKKLSAPVYEKIVATCLVESDTQPTGTDMNVLRNPVPGIGVAIAPAMTGVPEREALNHAVRTALGNGADYLFVVQPNAQVTQETMLQLLNAMVQNEKLALVKADALDGAYMIRCSVFVGLAYPWFTDPDGISEASVTATFCNRLDGVGAEYTILVDAQISYME